MNKSGIITAVIIMLSLIGCKKSSTSSNTTTTTQTTNDLNSTEKALLGTWQLKKTRDSSWFNSSIYNRDTTFEGYAATAYAKFTSTPAGDTYFQFADACNLSTNVVAPADKLSPGTLNSLWYYDESVKLLIIGSSLQYIIEKQTSSELILHCKQGGGNKYYHFTKQ